MNGIVIVFGGSGLIGRQVCACLKEDDWYVLNADLRDSGQFRDEYVHLDIDDSTAMKELIERERPAGIVNCAYPKTDRFGTDWHYLASRDFNQFMHLHVVIPFQMVRMGIECGCRNFVFVSSMYGKILPLPGMYAGTTIAQTPLEYAVAKAGLNKLVEYLASDLVHAGIRVNAVAPGGIMSPEMDDTFKENYQKIAPFTEPIDVGHAVAFLLGDRSQGMTGVILPVDRGFSL